MTINYYSGILTFESFAGVNVIRNNCRQSADQKEHHPEPGEVSLLHLLKQVLWGKMTYYKEFDKLIVTVHILTLYKG